MESPQIYIRQDGPTETQIQMGNGKASCSERNMIWKLSEPLQEHKSIEVIHNAQKQIRRKPKVENQTQK
jgi:hypothetical protein